MSSRPVSRPGAHPYTLPMPRKRQKFTKDRPPAPTSLAASWRLFVAVPVPPAVTTMVRDIVGRLSADDALAVRWVEPEQTHLTVQFIGEVPGEQAELIRMALAPAVASHQVFRLRTADLGVFPTIRRPRILWLGLHGPVHRLEALRDDVTAALTGIEAPHDDSPYHPHLTLGRVRSVANHRTRDLTERIRGQFDALMAEGLGSMREPIAIPVDDVVLMRSLLDHRGARHEVVERYPLAPRHPERTARSAQSLERPDIPGKARGLQG